MIKKLGLPYMGSKRAIASDLVDFILKENPNATTIIDGFAGGGAMAFEFLQRPQVKKVIYNDFNKGVVELLKDIKENGVTDKYYQWVDRETFKEHRLDPDWFGGFCQVVWSFGNNQRDYLYGKHIEEYKMWLHKIIVENSQEHLELLNDKFGLSLSLDILKDCENINDRRLKFMRELKKLPKGESNYTRLQHLNNLTKLEELTQLDLSKLDIRYGSYEDIIIDTPVEETIIYLDPPYQNTKRYELQIDHNKLWEYVKSSPYKIYLSSYEAPLIEVFSINHRSTLCATNNGKKVVEKLFVNKIEKECK